WEFAIGQSFALDERELRFAVEWRKLLPRLLVVVDSLFAVEGGDARLHAAPSKHQVAVGVAFAGQIFGGAMQRQRLRKILQSLLALPHRVIDEAEIVERRGLAGAVADAALDVEGLIEIVERLLLIACIECFERSVRERRSDLVAVADLAEEHHRAV